VDSHVYVLEPQNKSAHYAKTPEGAGDGLRGDKEQKLGSRAPQSSSQKNHYYGM
jgi:hypothetical protein